MWSVFFFIYYVLPCLPRKNLVDRNQMPFMMVLMLGKMFPRTLSKLFLTFNGGLLIVIAVRGSSKGSYFLNMRNYDRYCLKKKKKVTYLWYDLQRFHIYCHQNVCSTRCLHNPCRLPLVDFIRTFGNPFLEPVATKVHFKNRCCFLC